VTLAEQHADLAEDGASVDSRAMRMCADRGMPLADFEDESGRLPGEVLMGRVREAVCPECSQRSEMLTSESDCQDGSCPHCGYGSERDPDAARDWDQDTKAMDYERGQE
jgi:Zn ribbon nucleic-acid-binding protein